MSEQTQTKISQDQIDKLTAIADEYAQITADIGRGTVKIHLLEIELNREQRALQSFHNRYDELIAQETKIHADLLEKHGPGEVNFETGEFIPRK